VRNIFLFFGKIPEIFRKKKNFPEKQHHYLTLTFLMAGQRLINVSGQRRRLTSHYRVVDWLLTTTATYQVWTACFLACRSDCMELIAWPHPCWTWHSCFQENAKDLSF